MDYVAAGTVGVGLLAVATPLALAASLVRRRGRPGALPLLGVAVALAVGSLLHLLVVEPIAVGTAAESLAWTGGQWWVIQGAAATVVAGCVWTPFAFAYTGRGGLAHAGAITSGAILSTAAVAVAGLAAAEGVAASHVGALSVLLLATAILVAVGVGLLLLASVRQNAFPIVEPLLLSAGAVALCSGVLLAQRLDAAWLLLATNALAAGAFLVPVRRYPLFDTLPAARVAGRARVFEALSTGVLVVDRDGRVRDANERAASLFGVAPEAVPDRQFAELVGADLDPAAVANADTPVRLTTENHRTLELTGHPIGGPADRPVGTVVLCSDVTTRRVRAERFALLRRFVVDVVGDRMADVAESAADAADATEMARAVEDPDDPVGQRAADRIWTTTTALTRLVASARDVERAIGRDVDAGDDAEEDATSARAELRRTIDAAADAATEGTGVALSVAAPDRPVKTAVPQPLLRTILGTVLEDVCRRAETVDVAVTDADGPAIEIAWTATAGERSSDGTSAGDATAGGTSTSGASSGDTSADSAEADDRLGPLDSVAVARLAVEQTGGTLSRGPADDDREQIRIELPGVGSERSALAHWESTTSPGDDPLAVEPLAATTDRDDGGRL